MAALSNLINRLATWRGILILLALYGVVFGAIIMTLSQLTDASGGYGILDFEQGYTKTRVMEVLGSYGPEGMALYQRIQLLDLFNPALYSLIAATLTSLLWRGRGPGWLALFPLLGGLGDYMENITLFLMARAYPDVSNELLSISSTLSLLKNGLLVIGMLPLAAGLVVWLSRLIRRTMV